VDRTAGEDNPQINGDPESRMDVVVAGAGGGIGSRVARRLLHQDHSVVGLDRRRGALPDGVEAHGIDLTDETAVREVVAGREVDAVVTAAGWYEVGALEDCPPAEFRRHLEANLVTAHTVVHAGLPAVRRQRGRVVLVGSTVGSVALPYHGAYSAAKSGLHGYADALRRELSPRGVDVTLVEPGPARTGLNERAARSADDSDGPYDAIYEQFRGYSPQSVTPEQVADSVVTAVTADHPQARYRVGRRARWLPRLGGVLPTGLFDRLVRAGLPGGLLGRLVDR
jgi:NAD(P)-dependent dehydrogenase (short-subunit alcohol dehydrogenase family)